MNTTRFAALAVALAMGPVTLTSVAVSPLWSPRAQALADSVRVVPAAANATRHQLQQPTGNARAWALARSLRTVPVTGPKVDLVQTPRPTLPLKHPRYADAQRELRARHQPSLASH